MIPLYTDHEFLSAGYKTLLPLKCEHCGKIFNKTKNAIQCAALRKNRTYEGVRFCSRKCKGIAQTLDHPYIPCEQCGKSFRKLQIEIKRTEKRHGRHYCSHSCATRWRNLHKTTGVTVSRMEKWIAEELAKTYPSMEFHFNKKDAIGGELDIYIPSLKLAFELNGLFHYEPTFGQKKLEDTQRNDQRKVRTCLQMGIKLVVIDTSKLTQFKPEKCRKHLDDICCEIDSTLSRGQCG